MLQSHKKAYLSIHPSVHLSVCLCLSIVRLPSSSVFWVKKKILFMCLYI